MGLTILDCEQRSEAWFAARCGIVTASVVGQLLTPTLKVASNDTSRGVTAALVPSASPAPSSSPTSTTT